MIILSVRYALLVLGAYQKAEPEKGGESRSSIRAHRTLLVASPIRIDRVAQLTFTFRTCFRERQKHREIASQSFRC